MLLSEVIVRGYCQRLLSAVIVRGYWQIRGYLVTCQKNGINPLQAIVRLLKREIAASIKEELAKDDNNQNSREDV
ncbi:MAG: hypothetical protein LBF22_12455 [Deltaproteobacteria bacterium]|jgi:hypothetical protein|nr:hypothetical protein [Deltaproteobacteria bacterium]